MTDLNTLIPSASPLYLLTADGINDWGQIVGIAWQINLGEEHAYLATPSWYTSESATTAAPAERPKVNLPADVRKMLQRRERFAGFKGGLVTPR